jgi:hypothetical membrane protein
MKPSKMIQIFTEKYPFVGPTFWIASLQYYIVQIIVAVAWSTSYSLRLNTISDLGNTVCGLYGSRYVCSPLHGLMNLSFFILGVTMILGSILIYQEFKETQGSAAGFTAMAIAGFGTILVAFFPENTNSTLHLLGASFPFLIGNAGIVILGFALELPKTLKIYTILSGIVSLIALVLFSYHFYLGLGIGGMERIVGYPQTMWLIVFGIYISSNHFRSAQ